VQLTEEGRDPHPPVTTAGGVSCRFFSPAAMYAALVQSCAPDEGEPAEVPARFAEPPAAALQGWVWEWDTVKRSIRWRLRANASGVWIAILMGLASAPLLYVTHEPQTHHLSEAIWRENSKTCDVHPPSSVGALRFVSPSGRALLMWMWHVAHPFPMMSAVMPASIILLSTAGARFKARATVCCVLLGLCCALALSFQELEHNLTGTPWNHVWLAGAAVCISITLSFGSSPGARWQRNACRSVWLLVFCAVPVVVLSKTGVAIRELPIFTLTVAGCCISASMELFAQRFTAYTVEIPLDVLACYTFAITAGVRIIIWIEIFRRATYDEVVLAAGITAAGDVLSAAIRMHVVAVVDSKLVQGITAGQQEWRAATVDGATQVKVAQRLGAERRVDALRRRRQREYGVQAADFRADAIVETFVLTGALVWLLLADERALTPPRPPPAHTNGTAPITGTDGSQWQRAASIASSFATSLLLEGLSSCVIGVIVAMGGRGRLENALPSMRRGRAAVQTVLLVTLALVATMPAFMLPAFTACDFCETRAECRFSDP